MEFKVFEAEVDNQKFVIKEDLPGVGWYLYIFQDGKSIYDYLQDTLEICKEFAFEEFQVPKDSWVLKKQG